MTLSAVLCRRSASATASSAVRKAEIPKGDFSFEPKWDGFRSIVFRDGDDVEIGSRNERPMTRDFPEIVEAIKANLPERIVVDGEIVVPDSSGKRLEEPVTYDLAEILG
jgi:ATP-dependent DNA ligase